jgi:hypothetical protein
MPLPYPAQPPNRKPCGRAYFNTLLDDLLKNLFQPRQILQSRSPLSGRGVGPDLFGLVRADQY